MNNLYVIWTMKAYISLILERYYFIYITCACNKAWIGCVFKFIEDTINEKDNLHNNVGTCSVDGYGDEFL